MFNWGALTLFLYITMRMSGFVLFNPIFGRSGIPALFQAGFIGMLSVTVFFTYGGTAAVPANYLAFGLHLLIELGLGFVIAMIMRFFLYIADQAGEFVDTQMGMSMGRTYDPSSGTNMTVTANLLNILMILLFFVANGHITLLRLMITSGELVPFGTAYLLRPAADRAVELFAECALLAVKLALPILAAEMLGQVGMGVLMKVIPQINVFAINIELKVIIGLLMLVMLLSPMSEFLLEAESAMLREMRKILTLAGG